MNDVEVKEMEIFDWRKKVTEAECKLRQQENLLESVVSERNLYSKNLIEAQVTVLCSSQPQLIFRFISVVSHVYILNLKVCLLLLQEEIAEIKRKMKTMNNHVTRLRDEITGKELALAKDQQEHKRLEKDNESLKVL